MRKIQPHKKIHPHHQVMTQILDQSHLQAIHYRLWILSTAGPLLSGVSMMVLGISVPLLRNSFSLSPELIGFIAASLMGGTVIGALLSGHLADRFGRRPLLIINPFVMILGGLCLGLAVHAAWLIVGELLLGMAIGGDFPVASSYLSEFMPQNRRGRMLAAAMALQPIGMLLSAGIALWLLHGGSSTWHWLMFGQAALALPFFLGRWYLPESVRWLMSRGRNQEAAAILTRFAPTRTVELHQRATELGKIQHEASKTSLPNEGRWRLLFVPEYRRRTLLVTLPWFLMDMATYGVGLFTPLLFSKLIYSPDSITLLRKDWIDTIHSLQVNPFLLLGALSALVLIPRFGRIRMQFWGFLGMTIGLLVVWKSASDHWLMGVLLFGFALYNFTMNAGPNATTYILPTEMYPTQVRALGSGFAAAFAKIGATLAVFMLPILQSQLGVYTVLLAVAMLSLLAALLTYSFRVEGHGLTLEEHQGVTSLRRRQIPL